MIYEDLICYFFIFSGILFAIIPSGKRPENLLLRAMGVMVMAGAFAALVGLPIYILEPLL